MSTIYLVCTALPFLHQFAYSLCCLLDCWFAVCRVGDPVGDAQVGGFYEVSGYDVQLEGFIGVVLPDNALRGVLLEPCLPGLGELDLHLQSIVLFPI